MATRFYLPSSGNPDVTPSTWNFANQINPLTFKTLTTKIASAMTTKTEATGTVSPIAKAMLRYVSQPLSAQTISGTVLAQIRASESNGGANANLAIAVKIIKPDGTDRAVLLAQTASDSATAPYEIIVTTLTNSRVYDAAEVQPISLTSQSASAGDYLVIEIGFRSATTVSRTISLRYGDADASDLPSDVTTTTDNNPYVELSGNLTFQSASGTLSKTLGAMTGVITGAVTAITATGTLSKTLGAMTRSIAGTVLVQGSTSKTLGAMTRSIAGTVLVQGSTVKSLGGITPSISGTNLIQGSTNKNLGEATLVSTGSVSSSEAIGILDKPLGSIILISKTITENNPAFTLSLSGNISPAGEPTTPQLTPPSGKTTGDFIAGRIVDDSNPLGSLVSLNSTQYTELEWSLTSTNQTALGEVYEFRITRNGIPLSTYGVVPQITLENVIVGSLDKTLGGITTNISGTVDVKASLNKSLDALNRNISATNLVSASLNKTLGDLSLSSSGTVGFTGITGTLEKTLGTMTSSSSATISVSGSLSKTLGSISVASTGSVSVLASLTKSLGNISKSILGNVEVKGILNKTLGVMSGVLRTLAIDSGSLNKTLGTLTGTSSGEILVTGTLNKTLSPATLVSSGLVANVIYTATLNKTLGTMASTGAGKVIVAGTLNKTLDELTLYSSVSPLSVGTLNKTLGSMTASATGNVAVSGTVSKSLSPTITTSTGEVLVNSALNKNLGSLTISSTTKVLVSANSNNVIGELVSYSGGTVLVLGTSDNVLSDVTVDSSGSVIVTGNTAQILGEALLTSDGWSLFGRMGVLDATLGGITFSATGTVFDAPKYYHDSFITDLISTETSMLVEKKSDLFIASDFIDRGDITSEKKNSLMVKKNQNTISNL